MDAVVAEAWVTLDARLLREDVVVLALEVAHDFLEPTASLIRNVAVCMQTHANSLSILSPNPGVSTIVSAMRIPSSSSSALHVNK
jgi:hypothetical protein